MKSVLFSEEFWSHKCCGTAWACWIEFLAHEWSANQPQEGEKAISPIMVRKCPSLMGRNATQVTKNEALDSKEEMQHPAWLDWRSSKRQAHKKRGSPMVGEATKRGQPICVWKTCQWMKEKDQPRSAQDWVPWRHESEEDLQPKTSIIEDLKTQKQ